MLNTLTYYWLPNLHKGLNEKRKVEIVNRTEILAHCTRSEKKEVSNLLRLGLEAVKAANGHHAVKNAITRNGSVLTVADDHYNLDDYKNIYVMGMGKAAEPMVEAVYSILGDRIQKGMLLIRKGKKHKTLGPIRILESSHPVPTYTGYCNSQLLTQFAKEMPKKQSLYLVLLSGGGSSLYADFHPDLTVEEGIHLNELLIDTDASIGEINAVRKHTSQGKGGQLAQLLQGATIIPVILSDVLYNPLNTASGPVSPDVTTFRDAKTMLEQYGLWDAVPESVRTRIQKGVSGELPETPKPGDPCFEDVHPVVIADAATSCHAVKEMIETLYGEDYPVTVHEVAEGVVNEDLARTLLDVDYGFTLLGHEYNYGTTSKKPGEGGRQLHLLLLLLKVLKHKKCGEIFIEGIATDGKDGNSWAGALITPSLISNSTCKEIETAEKEENSGGFFKEKGFLIRMKSEYGLDDTGTNVNNILIIHKAY